MALAERQEATALIIFVCSFTTSFTLFSRTDSPHIVFITSAHHLLHWPSFLHYSWSSCSYLLPLASLSRAPIPLRIRFPFLVPVLAPQSSVSIFGCAPFFDPDIYLATAFSSPVLQIPHIIGSCRSWFFFEGGYLMMTM